MPTYLADKYQLGRELGCGGTCKVRLAKNAEGERVAAKIFKNGIYFDSQLQTELATMQKLKHPGVINVIEQGTGFQVNKRKGSKKVTYIILELAEGGELFDFIALGGAYSEPFARL
jgi:serine/threonine protein kinase